MEAIKNYDLWRTATPDEHAVTSCDLCGCELYAGDVIYTINGERMCEDCMNMHYREVL